MAVGLRVWGCQQSGLRAQGCGASEISEIKVAAGFGSGRAHLGSDTEKIPSIHHKVKGSFKGSVRVSLRDL